MFCGKAKSIPNRSLVPLDIFAFQLEENRSLSPKSITISYFIELLFSEEYCK